MRIYIYIYIYIYIFNFAVPRDVFPLVILFSTKMTKQITDKCCSQTLWLLTSRHHTLAFVWQLPTLFANFIPLSFAFGYWGHMKKFARKKICQRSAFAVCSHARELAARFLPRATFVPASESRCFHWLSLWYLRFWDSKSVNERRPCSLLFCIVTLSDLLRLEVPRTPVFPLRVEFWIQVSFPKIKFKLYSESNFVRVLVRPQWRAAARGRCRAPICNFQNKTPPHFSALRGTSESYWCHIKWVGGLNQDNFLCRFWNKPPLPPIILFRDFQNRLWQGNKKGKKIVDWMISITSPQINLGESSILFTSPLIHEPRFHCFQDLKVPPDRM